MTYATLRTCPRCAGVGVLPRYTHVDDGRCFACRGSGVAAWATRDIRAWGWAFTGQSTRIGFVASGIALLSAQGEEGAPTAAGWQDEILRLIADVLPLLSRHHFDAAIDAIRDVHHISGRWVAEYRPRGAEERSEAA